MEVTDRELLELAAKAAGHKKYYTHYLGRDSFVTYDETYYSEVKERKVTGEKTMDWNPLNDDGDALRLAVQLQIMIDHIEHGYMAGGVVAVCGFPNAQGKTSEYESINPDPYAATRRAIVRAAAAIGQSLPATSSASSS